jgi:hypothetical protein
MEAAAALGHMASIVGRNRADVNAEMPSIATSALIHQYRERCYDADAGSHLPLDFSDLGEFEVTLAVLMAIARARTANGFSPDSAVDLLLGALAVVDNRSSEYDSTGTRVLLTLCFCLHTMPERVRPRIQAWHEEYYHTGLSTTPLLCSTACRHARAAACCSVLLAALGKRWHQLGEHARRVHCDSCRGTWHACPFLPRRPHPPPRQPPDRPHA